MLRKVAPLASLRDLIAGDVTTTQPDIRWVDPTELVVDDTYQRGTSGETSIRLIRKIVSNWDWNQFKLPVVVEDADGALHVIDGQHTSIAAATHNALSGGPMKAKPIGRIPVMVIDAQSLEARAKAFIGQNTVRLNVTKHQLFQAACAAGDPDALTAKQVCERAGVKILLSPPGRPLLPFETMAIPQIVALAQKHGAMVARRLLEAIATAKVNGIMARQLRAAEMLMRGSDYAGDRPSYDQLTAAVAQCRFTEEMDVKTLAAQMGLPLYRATALHWFRHLPKPKKAAA